MSDQFLVIAKPHPLKTETVSCQFPVGARISDIVGPVADDAVKIAIEGEYIPREMWERIRPKAGTQIEICRFPRGRTVKKIIAIVILIIIAYFAPYLLSYFTTAFGTFWGTVAYIAVTMLATMAAYALLPPPEMPKMPGGMSNELGRLNAITGTSNQAIPYGTIPMVIGQCRFFPTYAANPYTEILGDKQYLRCLFDLGYGDNLDISDIKIGETPIADFDGVEYEITTNPTLFSDDVFEVSLGDAFNTGANVTKTSQPLANEISVDMIFPQGFFGVDSKGKDLMAFTTFSMQYRAVGSSGAWSEVNAASGLHISSSICTKHTSGFQISSSARKMQRIGIRWKVAVAGQYDVKLVRNSTTYYAKSNWATWWGAQGAMPTGSPSGATAPQAGFDSAQLIAIRTVKNTNPSKTGTLKLAMRIQASDQLNGVINQLSVLGSQKIRTWNSTTNSWNAPAVSLSPAWIYHWLLTTCPGIARKVTDDRVDLDTIIDWAAHCDAKNFSCQGMLDSPITMGELLKMVLASGRAAFALKDSKYSCIFDEGTQSPVQHFSPANSKNFAGQRVFADVPHALRVRFTNPALNWQEDEIIVLDDDHSFNGVNARGVASALPVATKFETLKLPFVADPIAAWQIARYHFAQAIFRPNVYSWETDVENLVCTRGDLVHCMHDVTDWGVGFGLISEVVRNGSSQVTRIFSAEPISYDFASNYTIRARSKTNTSYISNISAFDGGDQGPNLVPAYLDGAWLRTGSTLPVMDSTGVQFTGCPNQASAYHSVPALEDNTWYDVWVTVSGYTSGSVRAILHGDTVGQVAVTTNQAANGTFRSLIQIQNAGGSQSNRITLQATGSGTNTFHASVIVKKAAKNPTMFTLQTPMGSDVDMGDLYMIGTTEIATKQILITKIEPGRDLTATLQGVEFNSNVATFDDSPPPSFVSSISGTKILEPPPPPHLTAVLSSGWLGGGPGGLGGGGGGGGGGDPQVDVGPGNSGYFNLMDNNPLNPYRKFLGAP